MLTSEKYHDLGFKELGHGNKVQDRHGNIYYPRKARSPLQAIKLFCRECMGSDRRKKAKAENYELVRDCPDPMCPLYDFRFGKNPFLKRTLTDGEKKAAAARLSFALESHKKSSAENSERH